MAAWQRTLIAIATLATLSPPAMARTVQPEQFRCLALNIYWEARSESVEDQASIAFVTLNRVSSPDFPDTICGVVHQGGEDGACQFSWWCDGLPDDPENTQAWAEAQSVARAVLNGEVADPTGGALYYHLDTIMPEWASEMTQTAIVGPHVFYRRD